MLSFVIIGLLLGAINGLTISSFNCPLVAVSGTPTRCFANLNWQYTDCQVSNYTVIVSDNNEILFNSSFSCQNILPSIVEVDYNTLHAGYRTISLNIVTDSNSSISSLSTHIQTIPGLVTLLPPLLTLIMVFLTKNVLMSLFFGVYIASFFIYRYNPITAFIRSFDFFITGAIADQGHAQVLIFTCFLSGMVACLLTAGGGLGLVQVFKSFATSRRAVSLITMAVCLVIFFDDYANTLIVGQAMRPIAESIGLSPEKLAFLIDSTAAPLTSISPISSWVGFELSLIQSSLDGLRAKGEDISCYGDSAFLLFLQTIPGRFYPFLMIGIELVLVIFKRELGPMLHRERQSLEHDQGSGNDQEGQRSRRKLIDTDKNDEPESELKMFQPDEDTPVRWWNAVVPVAVTTFIVIIGLVVTGVEATKTKGDSLTGPNIFGNSDSYGSLIYGSVAGTITIWILCLVQRPAGKDKMRWLLFSRHSRHLEPLMSFGKSIKVFVSGIEHLVMALMILIMAWSVGEAFTEVGTGLYLSSLLDGNLEPGAYPALTFIMSAIIAIGTGTSWGTMGIMFPLILPSAHKAMPCSETVFLGTISSILAGAVFGDHCSPISDTTILSSVATGCELQSHVKTQAPYALYAGVISVLIGYLPVGFELYPAWAGLLLSLVIGLILIYFLTVPIQSDKIDPITRLTSRCRCRK